MKTVIITGGTKGIGADIARRFMDANYNVLIGSRSKSGLAKESHKNLKFQKMDVRIESDHHTLVKLALDWSSSLDCYINCAGFSRWSPVEEVDEAFWNEILDINLKGTFWGCKVAAEHLKPGGTIINVSSLASKRGSANNSVYCASKFGVNGITQSLAKELGSKGIRVNALRPGFFPTEWSKEHFITPERKQAILGHTPMGRYGNPKELVGAVLWLASDASSFVTGAEIAVDGGFSAMTI